MALVKNLQDWWRDTLKATYPQGPGQAGTVLGITPNNIPIGATPELYVRGNQGNQLPGINPNMFIQGNPNATLPRPRESLNLSGVNPNNFLQGNPNARIPAGTTTPNPTTQTPAPTTGGGAKGYNYINDPSYQFRMQEGLRGILGQASARGMLGSGRTLRELLRYGSDYASQEFQNEYLRRLGLAQLGMQAAGTQLGGANVPIPGVAGIGNLTIPQTQQTAFNFGPLGAAGGLFQGAGQGYGQAGQFQAAGQLGSTQAWQNTLSGLGNIFGYRQGGTTPASPSLTNTFGANIFSSPQTSGNFPGLGIY